MRGGPGIVPGASDRTQRKPSLIFAREKAQKERTPQETPSGIGFLGSPPPPPGGRMETRNRQASFLRGKRPEKDEHHSKPRVKTEVVRGGDKPWGLWGAKYWKTKHRREAETPQNSGPAVNPECFSHLLRESPVVVQIPLENHRKRLRVFFTHPLARKRLTFHRNHQDNIAKVCKRRARNMSHK